MLDWIGAYTTKAKWRIYSLNRHNLQYRVLPLSCIQKKALGSYAPPGPAKNIFRKS